MYQRTTQKRIERSMMIRNNIQRTHTTHISQIRGNRGHTKNQISRLYQITYDTNTILMKKEGGVHLKSIEANFQLHKT
jgi:hypothetical protein